MKKVELELSLKFTLFYVIKFTFLNISGFACFIMSIDSLFIGFFQPDVQRSEYDVVGHFWTQTYQAETDFIKYN